MGSTGVRGVGSPVVLGGDRVFGLSHPTWPELAGREPELLARVAESGWWAYEGPFEREFEREFAELQGARYGLCVANGTVALQLALEALDVGAGDEVVVPGFTWQATAAAALDVNATPVLVDADPETYCPDPAAIEAAIGPRTKAVVVVHLYGSLADMDRILKIARGHGLPVVEDCAHSHGARWRGRGAGSLGDVGTFSFQQSKTLPAGEGGCVTTSDPVLRERLYALRNCGRRRPGSSDASWVPVQSGNYRMTEWQAAVLCAQLERFGGRMARRGEHAGLLDDALACIPGVAPLRRQPEVTRRNPFAYVFRYDAASFRGLSGRAFRVALSAELGTAVRPPYAPLNTSALYQPQTKQRHHLNPAYWAAIDPSRFELPVARRAYESEAMVLPHEVLLAEREELLKLPEAVLRLREHAPRLAEWERSAELPQEPLQE